MAKTTGPLFSLEASGTVGHTVTYSTWKGRPYVRRRVIPLNPYEAVQVQNRNRMRAMAEGMSFAKQTALFTTPPGVRDELAIRAITPDGFAWNGFLVQQGIGANHINYDAAAAAWTALTAPQKTAWDDAADILVPAILPVAQGDTGGGYTTSLTSGNVFFLYRYALYIMALVGLPGIAPPTYA